MKEESERPRVVLDTNIFVSSVFWLGKPHRIVELAIDKLIEVFTSPEILEELENVLKRDFVEDHDFIESQTVLILEYAKVIRPVQKVQIVKDDPDDDKIIECAIAAHASYIVTGDPHLLKLKDFQGIKIVNPDGFLKLFT